MTIYFAEMGDWVKIGYTGGKVGKRLAQLQTGQPQTIILIGTIPGERDAEKELHKEFQHLRVGGEWFRRSRRLNKVISFLIDNQHPWYYCRAIRILEEEWEEAFKLRPGTDSSAYDDCISRPWNFSRKEAAGMKARAMRHKQQHGYFPTWFVNMMQCLDVGVDAHNYNVAWQQTVTAHTLG